MQRKRVGINDHLLMVAIEIRQPGGPEVLGATERPIPEPAPGEILVAVTAAGVNRPDVLQRQGRYAPPPGASDIPGLEIAGTVTKLGSGVRRWKEGDAVVGLVTGGGYAEFCVVNEAHALPVPAPLNLVDAAGLPETTFTVWHNVFQRGELAPGEWLLVHGGTSGIGTTAIQLAKARGAFVATTVGTEEKRAAARELGADCVVNYKTEDFVVAVRDATQNRGADVILDMVGGEYLARNIAVAAEDARIVQIGVQGGVVTPIDLWKVMSRRLILTGSTLRGRVASFKSDLAREVEHAVWPLIEQGRYRVVVDRIFPLNEAAAAHRHMECGEHIGKIILQVGT